MAELASAPIVDLSRDASEPTLNLASASIPAHVQALVLEYLPWQELGRAVSSTCTVLHILADAPRMWALKHAEHFGWASERLHAASVPFDSACAFQALRRTQRAAFRGECLDFAGRWLGRDPTQDGVVYYMRLTVVGGQAGDRLWRGQQAEGPFYLDHRMVTDEELDGLAQVPAAARGTWWNGRRADANATLSERGLARTGDEQPMGGHIQWFVGEDSDPATLQRVEAVARNIAGVSTITRRRAMEYVSGLFSPTRRKLVLAGTHLSSSGFGVLGLDQYDLTLGLDGLVLSGHTRGGYAPEPGQWLNEMSAEAYALPQPHIDGVDFVDLVIPRSC